MKVKTHERSSGSPADYRGRVAPWYQNLYLLDDAYPESDPRHVVLEGHCYRLANGKLGASGLIDPKDIVIGDVNYRRLAYRSPRCELCEGGDMIPKEERFYNSKYKPSTPPMSAWRLLFSKLRKRINRIRNLWDQRSAVKESMP